MRKIISSVFMLVSFVGTSQSLRELYQEGLKAHEEKNYELFLAKMISIDSMRPNYPAVVYNLAGGYALTGNEEKSIEILQKYILMDATQDFTQDDDFKSIWESNALLDIQKRQKELNIRIDPAEQKQFKLLHTHPESISYAEKQAAYFIGGVRDGNIWKVGKDGSTVLWAETAKNSWSVMGLQVSKDEKLLWSCTSSMSNYQAYKHAEEGYASVLKYDLKNGELLETYALPGGHNFGDLITDRNGNVYISDGIANKIYWISEKNGKLEAYVDLSGKVFNLQGLTLDETEENLFLSDYIDGIYKLNLKTKQVKKLKIEAEDILIKGIDGLYYKNNSLLGLHNGTKPNRVIKYMLSDDGNTIVDKEIKAQGGDLGEPTQGVWINDSFQFIMNSPWGEYDQDANFEPTGENTIIGIIN
ncbi:hypothetical protein [Ekhidna sp.]|uniref:hypothetical protein n=1 Tax=Ekhidna sp. TaxID=2608089 RepID=UPI0032983581